MIFKFKKDISKMIDFLIFPRIYFRFEEEMIEDDQSLEKVIKDDYKEFYEKTHATLAPYKDEIIQFYQKNLYSNYDFYNILLHAYPLYKYQNIHDYFRDLLNEDQKNLKENIIKALMDMEDNDDHPKRDYDELNATQYIDQLRIDSANKWNLFMMIQNAYNHLNKFVSLLNKIEPFFEATYRNYEAKIVQVGTEIVKRLSNQTEEALNQLTYNMIAYDVIEGFSSDFFVSFVMPYSLRFMESDGGRIVWGIEMEYSFRKVYELNQNKLVQRVKIFKALGDKTRYQTLKLISSGISSIKDIADELEVSSATISYHINEFVNSGILYLSREKGKKFAYKVDENKIKEVFADFMNDLSNE